MRLKSVIVDIDGTIANIDHRLHFVKQKPKDWKNFLAECVNDEPYNEIIDLIQCLKASNYCIVLCSGRSESVYKETVEWLAKYNVPYDRLFMRKEGDNRNDTIVKKEFLDALKENGRVDIQFVIDDRQSVVDMWRAEGLTCLQCRTWKDQTYYPGHLTLMIGPSGAGKSSYLHDSQYDETSVLSSDNLREELCGDFRSQAKNKQVFDAIHSICLARIESGLDVTVDATHLSFAERKWYLDNMPAKCKIAYLVINRPLQEKLKTQGWRASVAGLVEKHDTKFIQNLPDILAGDNDPRVTVIDKRIV